MRANVLLAALALVPATAALAQGPAPRERILSERVIVERRAGPPVAARGPTERVCVPWCPADLNPCDPPDYKRADGRCMWDN